MVMLKVNEMQLNSNGVTLKTSKDHLKIWRRNIDAHYSSMNYTVVTKDLNNNGKQDTYILEPNKFIFEYYSTGRIVVKTKNMEELRLNFIDNHESILRVKLEVIGSLVHKSLATVSKRNIPTTSSKLPCPTPLPRQLNSSEPSQSDPTSVGSVKVSKTSSEDYESLCEYVYEKQENEIADLKSELIDLKEEINQLKENVKVLQTKEAGSTLASTIEDLVKQAVMKCSLNVNDIAKQTNIDTQKKAKTFESLERKKGHSNNPQVKSVKYLTEQYQKLSVPRNPRNK